MREYALIMLNMFEYACIYESSNNVRILNVSDVVLSIRSMYKLQSSYRERNVNQKPGAQPKMFQGRGGFEELGHFDKHFVKNTRKKALQGNILEFFLLDTLKTTFWIENLTERWTQWGPFFPKAGHFFQFSKKGWGVLLRVLNMLR